MYTPRIPPQEDAELLPYLDDELVRISQEINNLAVGQFSILYSAPLKVKPGMVVYADGVQWNPGSGEGLYRRTLANTWQFVG